MTRRKWKRKTIIKNLKLSIKEYIKSLPKKIAMNFVYMCVGVLYVCYLLIKHFDNTIAKIYMKLPRLARVCVVYVLIIGFMFNFVDIKTTYSIENNVVSEAKEEEQTKETENIEIEDKKEETREEKIIKEEYNCNLDETSCMIYYKAIEKGFSQDQAIMTVAISMAECGRQFNSKNCIENNNYGGLWNGKTQSFYKYSSKEEGINAFVNLIAKYLERGQTTPEKIQPTYAPVGANNDPNNKNSNWLKNVKNIMTDLYNQMSK